MDSRGCRDCTLHVLRLLQLSEMLVTESASRMYFYTYINTHKCVCICDYRYLWWELTKAPKRFENGSQRLLVLIASFEHLWTCSRYVSSLSSQKWQTSVLYFEGCQHAQASGKKLQFARRKLMTSDILCYFHAAHFLESISQLLPAQLE